MKLGCGNKTKDNKVCGGLEYDDGIRFCRKCANKIMGIKDERIHD